MNIKKKDLLGFLIVIASYTLVLSLPLPTSFTIFFKKYSPTLFFLIFGIYSLVFKCEKEWRWILGLSMTLILFALPLSYLWYSGYSDNKILGGMLPYKDAFYYYNGARLILDGVLLPQYSVQAAGRPLFPGFMASILLFTGKNLQASIFILVGLLGVTSYLPAEKLREKFGIYPAALYMAFFFLYAHSQIGYFHTEILGLIFGSLGFVLAWQALEKQQLSRFIFAILILMIAISARAGAFFIFPILALWAGWIFRGNTRFSWRNFGIFLSASLLSYLIVNTLYSHLVVAPGNYSFGNFSYAIYGQIHGGTGWHRAIEELGTRDPDFVMSSAIQFFKAHPLSLFIGIAKSYRDFFVPNGSGIFTFYGSKIQWLDNILWIISLLLLLFAIFRVIKNIKDPYSSFLLASFIGVFLSIPFLPPVDGGKRFYASTMPFFFALIVTALPFTKTKERELIKTDKKVVLFSGLLALMTLFIPVVIIRLTSPTKISSFACPTNQVSYAIRVDPNAYVDFIQDAPCGKVPSLCLNDFANNGAEKNVDLLFQRIVHEAVEENSGATRLLTANNLVPNGMFQFFINPTALLASIPPRTTIIGCATPIILETMKSRPVIYKVESILSP